ncbi:MAG: radical SAM protein [Vitreoscilla sp.]|nr:radical SAM protein [Vitreoscilla sp.]
MKLGKVVALGSRRLGQELREAFYLRTGLDGTRPLAIRAHPTERCNYRCGSCKCWRLDDYPPEMPLGEWCRALADLRGFVGPYCVQFAGGEPFVYKPFLALVEWCAAHRIDWGMITNGSALSPANVARLVAATPLNIDVSVDGASSAVHDASRGVPGSLVCIAKGLRTLRRARDAAGGSFPIRVKPTVHRRNLHEMPQLVEWAVSAGATSIDFSPVRPWTPEVGQDLWLRPQDERALEQAIESLVAAKRAGAPIETEESRLLAWPSHFRGEWVQPDVAPCRVGLRDFHILANGDVRMCWEYPPIGNIRRSSAREVWTGPVASAQRATMMQCANFGSPKCASSCLAHRTMGQDWKRVALLTRREL